MILSTDKFKELAFTGNVKFPASELSDGEAIYLPNGREILPFRDASGEDIILTVESFSLLSDWIQSGLTGWED